LYRTANVPEFIDNDPVQFPRRYRNVADQEIAAFLVATIAWGRRDLILKSAEKMFALMGESPYAFVMDGGERALKGGCIHRTFFQDDLRYFCRGFRECYTRYGSLQALFASAADVWEGIALFRETMAQANTAAAATTGKRRAKSSAAARQTAVYSKHVANPASASACKRLNLALRWLVRREGPVDLGVWRDISPAALFIPLDVHVGRSARTLGLLNEGRKSNDKKAVISLTEKLRALCPEDPIKYDLALFLYGVEGLSRKS